MNDLKLPMFRKSFESLMNSVPGVTALEWRISENDDTQAKRDRLVALMS